MRKTGLTLAVLLFALANTTNAQKWSAGYRTGVVQDNFQFNDQFAQGHNLLWSNQVFVDRKLSKHIELELTLGYSQLKHGKSFSDIPESQITIIQSWETKFLTTAINVKYYFLQQRQWEAFGFAGLGSIKRWSHFKQDYTGTPISPKNTPFRSEGDEENQWPRLSAITAGAGLNYNLIPRLFLSGLLQLTYKAEGNSYFTSTVNTNDFSPAIHLGLGYRF